MTVSGTASGQSHSTGLRCGNWKLLGSPQNPKGYKYRDPELDDGTAKLVVWKDGKLLKAVLQGSGLTSLAYDLQVGTAQGTVRAVLESGAMAVCSACAAHEGQDGSDGKRFTGRDCPAPLACP